MINVFTWISFFYYGFLFVSPFLSIAHLSHLIFLSAQFVKGIPDKHVDERASLQYCEQSPAAETPGIKAKLTNDTKVMDNKLNFINLTTTLTLLAI